jgi:23S rRNA (pseudouridine1915-N3)-methyltransferase
MKIRLIQIGKTQESYLQEAIDTFSQRINKFIPFEIQSLQGIKNAAKLSEEQLKEKEAVLLMQQLKAGDYVVLLDERGKELGSQAFSSFLQQQMNSGVKNVFFIVGGAYGVSDKIKNIANYQLSLSKMTFTHQMIRLIFVEQLYRAYSIIHNLPYHHD